MIKLLRRFLWYLQVSDPDPDAFLRELKSAQLGRYSRMQMYKDFRTVFLGTPAGKRVLWKILEWAHVYKSNMNNDSNLVIFREGERNLGLKVMRTMNTEPSATRQTETKEKEE